MSVLSDVGAAIASVIAHWNWDGHHGWDDGGWVVMGIGMVLFWALVIVGIVLLVRTLSGGQGRDGSSSGRESTASEVLARRLAEGEISVEEYEQSRRALTGDRAG